MADLIIALCGLSALGAAAAFVAAARHGTRFERCRANQEKGFTK